MENKIEVKNILKLLRIQTAGLTALSALFGYLAVINFYDFQFWKFILLFLLGLCAHFHGFVSNEIADYKIDRLSEDLKHKPIVGGKISLKLAWLINIIPAIVAYMIFLLVFKNIYLWLIFIFSHICEIIYNFFGKKFPGSDIFLALWGFSFVIIGSFTAQLSFNNFYEAPRLLPLPLLIGLLGAFQLFFNNAIEGGIKDCDHDLKGGAKTLVSYVFKAKVIDNKLEIPLSLKKFAIIIKLIPLFLSFSPYLFPSFFHYENKYIKIQIPFHFLLTLVSVFSMMKFLNFKVFDRNKLKRYFSIHEISITFIMPVILLGVTGYFWFFFLMFFPLIWFLSFNYLLYGTLINPGV